MVTNPTAVWDSAFLGHFRKLVQAVCVHALGHRRDSENEGGLAQVVSLYLYVFRLKNKIKGMTKNDFSI